MYHPDKKTKYENHGFTWVCLRLRALVQISIAQVATYSLYFWNESFNPVTVLK